MGAAAVSVLSSFLTVALWGLPVAGVETSAYLLTVVCVVVTPEVVFGFTPSVVLVTLKITVQFPLAGIVIPVKLRAVALAAKVLGVVPTHVPVTDPPTALMLARVSVNAPPVSADALPFVRVRVTVEAPPD